MILRLTLPNILPLHVFEYNRTPSHNQNGVTFPALVFLLTGFTPDHTEVTGPVKCTARVCRI